MNVLCVALAAALLAAGAATAQPQTTSGGDVLKGEAQNFITREWTWFIGTVRTTFTARGPSEQVDHLDPQADPLACQGCELASSIQFELDDEFQPNSTR